MLHLESCYELITKEKAMIFPKKLEKGSHIRVIAPARSMAIIGKERKNYAVEKLEELGLRVSFGRHIDETDTFNSSSIASRIDDLHEAFSDNKVDGVLTVIGGYNSNQLLEFIDYDLISHHPKILCGYSDITALSTAIFTKTGLVGYSGPHFSSFSMKKGMEYSIEYFKKCLFQDKAFDVMPAPVWSDDAWYLDQENRNFEDNNRPVILNGENVDVSGKIIGGHLRCLNALQGTEYWPSLKDCILFVEEDEEINAELFDRQIQSILHQKDASGIKAIIIGRFQKKSEVTIQQLEKIFIGKKALSNTPIIANFDFGHTTPIITFPIGGTARLTIKNKHVQLSIIEH